MSILHRQAVGKVGEPFLEAELYRFDFFENDGETIDACVRDFWPPLNSFQNCFVMAQGLTSGRLDCENCLEKIRQYFG